VDPDPVISPASALNQGLINKIQALFGKPPKRLNNSLTKRITRNENGYLASG
jgi:hypothetical protein